MKLIPEQWSDLTPSDTVAISPAIGLYIGVGPKGLEGLKVRQWACSVCGSVHDRDTNAARNILVRGLLEMEKEFAAAVEAKADEAAVNETAKAVGVGHDPLAVGIFGL